MSEQSFGRSRRLMMSEERDHKNPGVPYYPTDTKIAARPRGLGPADPKQPTRKARAFSREAYDAKKPEYGGKECEIDHKEMVVPDDGIDPKGAEEDGFVQNPKELISPTNLMLPFPVIVSKGSISPLAGYSESMSRDRPKDDS